MDHCSVSVSRQLASVEKLIGLDFVWLLPGLLPLLEETKKLVLFSYLKIMFSTSLPLGHGRRFCFESVEDKDNQLKGLVERERGIRSS